jgi:PAS domain S-box-containing protein
VKRNQRVAARDRQDLQARLDQAEAPAAALRGGEVDAVISHSAMLLPCVQEGERTLQETAHRYRSLFEHSLDAMLLTATDGRILMSNPAARRLFGWTADELCHMHEDALIDARDAKTAAAWAARVRAGQFHGELTYLRKDGSAFAGEMSSSTFGAQNEEKKNSVVIRDVTERKRAEESLHNLRAQIADMTRLRSIEATLALIAGEINQPLGAIVNNSNVCMQLVTVPSRLQENMREVLSDIMNDAHRASAIVARIRAALRETLPQKTSVQIKDVVADVLALSHRELAARRIIARIELAEDLPQVSADRVQLQQVLLNLVINGSDAMSAVTEERRILTIAGERDKLDGRPAVLVTVSDRGAGLKKADRERVFEAFYTTKPSALGMGLCISRSIMEAHGGRIWATSHDPPGTILSCALPAEDTDE